MRQATCCNKVVSEKSKRFFFFKDCLVHTMNSNLPYVLRRWYKWRYLLEILISAHEMTPSSFQERVRQFDAYDSRVGLRGP